MIKISTSGQRRYTVPYALNKTITEPLIIFSRLEDKTSVSYYKVSH